MWGGEDGFDLALLAHMSGATDVHQQTRRADLGITSPGFQMLSEWMEREACRTQRGWDRFRPCTENTARGERRGADKAREGWAKVETK